MGGAFVAVADDASAGFWNPGGLVKGPLAGLTIAADTFHFRDPRGPATPGAGRLVSQSVAFGAWPVGVSFVRVSAAGIGRDSAGHPQAEALTTQHFGLSVLQSLGDFVVVGATAKFVRGGAAIGPIIGGTADDTLRAVEDARGDSRGAFDLDFGIVAGSDRFRAAASFKNLLQPEFGTSGGTPISLQRRARFGLAALPTDGLTLAIDVDLDTADPLVGLRRTVALGGEVRLAVRLTLRAGIRWERGEGRRPIGAFGGSLGLRQGLWLDGYVSHGRSRDRGFGLALRGGV
jgi:hypothetical protein